MTEDGFDLVGQVVTIELSNGESLVGTVQAGGLVGITLDLAKRLAGGRVSAVYSGWIFIPWTTIRWVTGINPVQTTKDAVGSGSD